MPIRGCRILQIKEILILDSIQATSDQLRKFSLRLAYKGVMHNSTISNHTKILRIPKNAKLPRILQNLWYRKLTDPLDVQPHCSAPSEILKRSQSVFVESNDNMRIFLHFKPINLHDERGTIH